MASLEDRILSSSNLPEASPQVSKLMAALKYPDVAKIDEVVDMITEVPNLENVTLSIVNSTRFALTRELDSLREAILYLGASKILYLLIALLTKSLLNSQRGRSRTFNRKRYWHHCVGTAIAGQTLCTNLKRGDPFKLFTYSIVHDLGLVILDMCAPAHLDELSNTIQSGLPMSGAELSCLDGLTHGDIGAAVFERWGMPTDVCNATRYHHHPHRLIPSEFEVELLHVADTLSSSCFSPLVAVPETVGLDHAHIGQLQIGYDMLESIRRELPSDVENEVTLLAIDALEADLLTIG